MKLMRSKNGTKIVPFVVGDFTGGFPSWFVLTLSCFICVCVSNTNMRYIECFAKTADEDHTCDMATSLRIAQEAEVN